MPQVFASNQRVKAAVPGSLAAALRMTIQAQEDGPSEHVDASRNRYRPAREAAVPGSLAAALGMTIRMQDEPSKNVDVSRIGSRPERQAAVSDSLVASLGRTVRVQEEEPSKWPNASGIRSQPPCEATRTVQICEGLRYSLRPSA